MLSMYPTNSPMAGVATFLPLETSKNASKGSNLTLTRADATSCATVTDFEGNVRTCKANEIRETGARRVENLLTFSEDFSNAAWVVTNSGVGVLPIKTPNYGTAPDGTLTACRIQLNKGGGTAAGDISEIYQNTLVVGCRSIWAKSLSGSVVVNMSYVAGGTGNVTINTEWKRLSPSYIGGDRFRVELRGDMSTSDTADILIWHPQFEAVSGQSNQNPSEYVSNGAIIGTPEHVYLTGVAGTYISTPDSVANSITGNIDIICKVALNDWSPATANMLISKSDSAGTQRSYFLQITTSGNLQIGMSPDGTGASLVTVSSTADLSAQAANATLWCRVTRAVIGGVVKFYTSTNDTTWTQLGTDVALSAGNNLFDGTSPITVGAADGGISNFASGKIYSAQIYNGIRESGGTLAVNFNAALATTPTGTITASTGEVWTLNGAAKAFGPGSIDYHGAGVDGIKNFATTNGNTVSGNIVTEATGTPLTTLKGLLPEPTRTNLVWPCGYGVAGVTQTTAALTAASYTLSFKGTGSVTGTGGFVGTLAGTGANNTVSLTVTATAAAAVLTVTGSITEMQLELGATASSPIITTTAAVTRAVEVDTIPSASNITAAAGSICIEWTPNAIQTGDNIIVQSFVDASNYTALIYNSTGSMIVRKRIAAANNDATYAISAVVGTTYRLAGSWGAAGVLTSVNGVSGTLNANTTNAQISATISIASVTGEVGSKKNLRPWTTQLTQAQLNALTK